MPIPSIYGVINRRGTSMSKQKVIKVETMDFSSLGTDEQVWGDGKMPVPTEIVKRDGNRVPFNPKKIKNLITHHGIINFASMFSAQQSLTIVQGIVR